ncbi:MAG: lysophospholipase [Luteimonas sp.]|nr:lysophospholipase [Luteimonas sp.]
MTPQRARSGDASAGASMRLRLLRSSFALGSWLMPGATVRRAHRLFDTPLASSRTRARAHPPPASGLEFMRWQDERLALYRWGDPVRQPTVLFVHGWSSYGQRYTSWLPALRAAGYAVVAFDQLGHGRSSGHRNNLPGFVDAVVGVARHLGIGAAGRGQVAPRKLAAVIGHSLGAAAVSLALSRGLSAQRVVLIAPPADLHAASRRFARLIGLSGHLVRPLVRRFHEQTGVDPLVPAAASACAGAFDARLGHPRHRRRRSSLGRGRALRTLLARRTDAEHPRTGPSSHPRRAAGHRCGGPVRARRIDRRSRGVDVGSPGRAGVTERVARNGPGIATLDGYG